MKEARLHGRGSARRPPACRSAGERSGRKLSRRRFLGRIAAAGAGLTIVPRHVLGASRTAPSGVLTRGVIGTGGMGMGHVRTNEKGKPPVCLAVCDVDKNHLARAVKKAGDGCTPYSDWRRIIDRKDIDVVHIPTPPHWHALISIAACQAGKDVYSEKPMTRFIAEGRAVVEAVRRYGRVYTINCSGRDNRMRKLVMSGLLGWPLTVRVGSRTGYNWKVRGWSGRTDLVPQAIPPQLDYNMWLGPAPVKPYHPHRVHGSFRGYWDYDGGGLSDMGQHYLDPIQYAIGKTETGPVEVEAYAPWPAHPDACGLWGRITHTYQDGTRIIIESGEWGEPEPYDHPLGPPFMEGPRGKVWRNGDSEPESIYQELGRFPEPPRLVGFDEAVRTRRQPSSRPDVEAAQRSVSLLHLTNIAIRTGRTIRWDPVRERVVGDEEANRLVNVPMRAPWHLPSS